MSDPFLELHNEWVREQQEKAEQERRENQWRPQIPQKVYEDAKYFRRCPMCRGYLEKRGDFYTCQTCPFEYPYDNEHIGATHYHWSPERNRQSIEENGLLASPSLDSLPAVYLHDEFDRVAADDAAPVGWDVWAVDTTDIPIERDPISGESQHWRCRGDIGPERLQRIWPTAPVRALNTSSFQTFSSEIEGYLDERRAEGLPLYVALKRPVTLELRGGKQPIPGAAPYDVSTEGVPLYNYMELGWNPETEQREYAAESDPGGAPEWRGQYAEFPANRRGEVIDYDHALGWAMLWISLNYPQGEDARYHPMGGLGWVDYNDLRPIYPRTPPHRYRSR
ncbi:MAG: hypothetical protein KGL39_28275 [Patescibacteria group bacterium]|nr:hypothetical protein [Patescibacteria group bacterium]